MSLKKETPRIESMRLAKRCIRYFGNYKARIALAVLAMGVVAACTAASAWLVQPALDDIFIRQDRTALFWLPIVFVVITALKGVSRFVQNYEMNYAGLKVLEDVRRELFDKIICLPLKFYEENQVGILMSRIINDVALIRSSLPSVIMLVRQVLTMASLIGVVFYRDPYLATWAVLVMPLAFFPFIYLGRKLRKLGRKNQSKIADISAILQEIFSGVRVVKAFANEKGETERFEKENNRLVSIAVKQVVMNELSSPIMECIGAVGAGLVIWYGGSRVIAGESTPGAFFSFLAGLIMLYDPIKRLTDANLEIQRALAGAERVFEILDDPEIEIERGGAKSFKAPFRELEFKGTRLTYPGCPTPALDDVDLVARAGQRVAIVGPSGAGKTTLVNVIPRFYQPDAGAILLNGEPVESYDLASLRRAIGMVSQDAFLFNATVRENIAYACEGVVDQAAVEAAAQAAYAHDFILSLPEGYDTVVGERGVKLSGGQKQRITIARALFKDPPLLILDEATSALDTESERIVQMALENLMRDRTSIVIAHRLSTILTADLIVVMDKGRVVATGTNAELLRSSPLYARLHQMQFREESPRQAADFADVIDPKRLAVGGAG